MRINMAINMAYINQHICHCPINWRNAYLGHKIHRPGQAHTSLALGLRTCNRLNVFWPFGRMVHQAHEYASRSLLRIWRGGFRWRVNSYQNRGVLYSVSQFCARVFVFQFRILCPRRRCKYNGKCKRNMLFGEPRDNKAPEQNVRFGRAVRTKSRRANLKESIRPITHQP